MFVASLTVDQRERASCLSLIALGSDATLFDLEVVAVAGMAACALSFRRFARGESTSTEPAPEILSSSLFIQREGFSLRDKDVTANHSPASQLRRGRLERQTWEIFTPYRRYPFEFSTGASQPRGTGQEGTENKIPTHNLPNLWIRTVEMVVLVMEVCVDSVESAIAFVGALPLS